MGILFSENFAELGGNVVICDVNESVLYPDVPVDGVYLSDHRPVGAFVEIE